MDNAKEFDLDPMINMYCYVNEATKKVEALATYSLFGVSFRKESDWFPVDGTDKDLIKYLNSGDYQLYRIPWTTPDEMPDPKDKRAWEHPLVNKWDDGDELTGADLDEYAILASSGELEERSVIPEKRNHIMEITVDTIDGATTHEIDLDTLPIEEIEEMIRTLPGLRSYYVSRLSEET